MFYVYSNNSIYHMKNIYVIHSASTQEKKTNMFKGSICKVITLQH